MSSRLAGAVRRRLEPVRLSLSEFSSSRAAVSCAVVQCLCCSLRAGVLFLAFIQLVNASLAFAGEALLAFDLAAAVVTNLEGKFLPPGTRLETDSRVHGALIGAGVYSLISSLVGFWAVCRRSLRAATAFFVLQVLNSLVALALLAVTWMAGGVSLPAVMANVPGIILMLYLCVVTSSYRLVLREAAAAAAGGAVRLPPARAGGFSDDDDGDDEAGEEGGGGGYRDRVRAASASGGFDDAEEDDDLAAAAAVKGGPRKLQQLQQQTAPAPSRSAIAASAVAAAAAGSRRGGAAQPGVAVISEAADEDDDGGDDDADLGVARGRRI